MNYLIDTKVTILRIWVIMFEEVALNVRLLSITSVVPERFLSNLLECRHFRIRCLHALKEMLVKCAVILTSKLKFSDETLGILWKNNIFVK